MCLEPGRSKQWPGPEIRRRVGGSTAALTSKNLQWSDAHSSLRFHTTRSRTSALRTFVSTIGDQRLTDTCVTSRHDVPRVASRLADSCVAQRCDQIGVNIWARVKFPPSASVRALPRRLFAQGAHIERHTAVTCRAKIFCPHGDVAIGTSARSVDCRTRWGHGHPLPKPGSGFAKLPVRLGALARFFARAWPAKQPAAGSTVNPSSYRSHPCSLSLKRRRFAARVSVFLFSVCASRGCLVALYWPWEHSAFATQAL